MTNVYVPTGANDSTWVTIDLPFSPSEALRFCHDIKGLLWLNPYLDIHSWQEMDGPFVEGKRYHMQVLNEMTGIEHDMELTLTELTDSKLCLNYSTGVKKGLEILATLPDESSSHPKAAASILTMREFYDTAQSVEVLEKEVDRSLFHWGASLRRYLRNQRRFGWLPGYRRVLRFWLTMSPRNRRIGRWLIWIGMAEFFFFLFILIIYVLEHNGP